MPLPKRKHSKARGRKRRSHNALTVPNYTHCTHCDATIPPHSICDRCGYYRDEQLVDIKEKESKPKRKS